MSDYKQVKSAVDAALSHTRAALKVVSESRPANEPGSKGLIASVRAAVKAADDPRNQLLATLSDAVFALESSYPANERLHKQTCEQQDSDHARQTI